MGGVLIPKTPKVLISREAVEELYKLYNEREDLQRDKEVVMKSNNQFAYTDIRIEGTLVNFTFTKLELIDNIERQMQWHDAKIKELGGQP